MEIEILQVMPVKAESYRNGKKVRDYYCDFVTFIQKDINDEMMLSIPKKEFLKFHPEYAGELNKIERI